MTRMCSRIRSLMMLSITFPNWDVKLIGLSLAGSRLLPFFNKGTTLAFLQSSGTWLSSRLCWKIITIGVATCSASSLNIRGYRPCLPLISVAWTSHPQAGCLAGMSYSLWSMSGRLVLSSAVKSELKKSFRMLACSLGSSTASPLSLISRLIVSFVRCLDLAYLKKMERNHRSTQFWYLLN